MVSSENGPKNILPKYHIPHHITICHFKDISYFQTNIELLVSYPSLLDGKHDVLLDYIQVYLYTSIWVIPAYHHHINIKLWVEFSLSLDVSDVLRLGPKKCLRAWVCRLRLQTAA